MNVAALTNMANRHVPPAHGRTTSTADAPATTPPAGQTEPDDLTSPEMNTDPSPTDVASSGSQETEKGVIRLLQEGHFKGVANVRLHINFFEELSASSGALAANTAQASTGDLIAVLGDKAREILDGWQLDDETRAQADDLLAQFDSAAQAALDEASTGGKVDTTALTDALRQAFQSLTDQLAALAPIPPSDADESGDEPPADADTETVPELTEQVSESPDTTVDDAGQEPETPAQNADLQSLTQFFETQLNDLLETIREASELPPLTSPAPGNGKAYGKFLQIYNDLLLGSTAASPSPQEQDEVDVVA